MIIRYGKEKLSLYEKNLKHTVRPKLIKSRGSMDLEKMYEEFSTSMSVWEQLCPELIRIYNIEIEENDQSLAHNYKDTLKIRSFLKVKNSQSTFRLVTSQGVVTIIKASSCEWDWMNTQDYWPLEFHKETLFRGERVPHLINVFFFRPKFIANSINYGKYRIYIRQALDQNCNLMDKCTLTISAKESKESDDSYQTIHEMPFIAEDMFHQVISKSPSFVDCLLLDFNFEEEEDDNTFELKINRIDSSNEAPNKMSPFIEMQQSKNQKNFKTFESNIIKTIDVKFEFSSQSLEWKQGWWVDGFIFEPVFEFMDIDEF